MQNFADQQNKLAYAYLLTTRFLQRKQQEYVAIQAEIAALQLETQAQAPLLAALGLYPADPENIKKIDEISL